MAPVSKTAPFVLALTLAGLSFTGCGGDSGDDDTTGGESGEGGTAGKGGAAGKGGSAGATAGKGGSTGKGGSAGASGAAGKSGTGGSSGEGGEGGEPGTSGGFGGEPASAGASGEGSGGTEGGGTGGMPAGEAGAAGSGESGGAGGASGGESGSGGEGGAPELPASTCTGPGSANPGGIVGFPPDANVPIGDGSWQGWDVSHGTIAVVTDAAQTEPVLHHVAPGEGDTSYLLAPASLLGDLAGAAGISFDLKSSGGTYYESGYAYLGDVVIQSGSSSAYSQITHAHDGEWHSYFVPFDFAGGACWSTDSESLGGLLGDVTGLAIRAEFGVGNDEVWLANVAIVPR